MKVWTDGACFPNPGDGAWAWVSKDAEEWGKEKDTTNNRMELLAVIKAIHAHDCERLIVYTDSQYVSRGYTSWMHRWQKKGWKLKANKPVKNKDLWDKLFMIYHARDVEVHWIRGHSGHPMNERADFLATALIQRGYHAHHRKQN